MGETSQTEEMGGNAPLRSERPASSMLLPTLCEQCRRMRTKREDHLAEQGLVECRLKEVPAGDVLVAFDAFSKHKRVDSPFRVEAAAGVTSIAWPFQFHPRDIAACEGRLVERAEDAVV